MSRYTPRGEIEIFCTRPQKLLVLRGRQLWRKRTSLWRRDCPITHRVIGFVLTIWRRARDQQVQYNRRRLIRYERYGEQYIYSEHTIQSNIRLISTVPRVFSSHKPSLPSTHYTVYRHIDRSVRQLSTHFRSQHASCRADVSFSLIGQSVRGNHYNG